jgi:SAM-dependent methyltransferase
MMDIKIKRYIEWDVNTWGRAIDVWREYLNGLSWNQPKLALELGGRRGGLSYFLATEYDCTTICSDLFDPVNTAKPLHETYGLINNIVYRRENCLNISMDNESVDIVIFKSVIGALGSKELQQRAINEIFRCLKPGGVLLFAENLSSTCFHRLLRKYLTPWNKYWYYPTKLEFESFLSNFGKVDIYTTGFISNLFPTESLKFGASKFDEKVQCYIPQNWNYVIFGLAVKK